MSSNEEPKRAEGTAADDDQVWADRLAPNRRKVLAAGLAMATLGGISAAAAGPNPGGGPAGGAGAKDAPPKPSQSPSAAKTEGKSPWGYETYKEPTPAPVSVRPGEQKLPTAPRKRDDEKRECSLGPQVSSEYAAQNGNSNLKHCACGEENVLHRLGDWTVSKRLGWRLPTNLAAKVAQDRKQVTDWKKAKTGAYGQSRGRGLE